jgi:purine-binding chemotaxis protein CheW
LSEAVLTKSKLFLIFKLGNDEYGIDTSKITAIIEKNMAITRVPNTPGYIKGVINLRGEIIPVMDLRERFNLPCAEYTENTRIIIANVNDVVFGVIVDHVSEVVHLAEDAIENISNFNCSVSMEYFRGAVRIQNRIIMVIKLEKLIDIQE